MQKAANADIPGFHARSIAGGMFFDDRWVYFAFIINWNALAADDPDTVNRFFDAINLSLTIVKEGCQNKTRAAVRSIVPRRSSASSLPFRVKE
jgi:hypothetical protein